MKKILLGFIMLVTAATMNAQVKLEYVLEGYGLLGAVRNSGRESYPDDEKVLNDINIIGLDDFFLLQNLSDGTYSCFNAEGELHVNLKYMSDDTVDAYEVIAIARNVFTTDGKICRLVKAYEAISDGSLAGNYYYVDRGIYIIDEDGNTIQKLTSDQNNVDEFYVGALLIKVANQYKLLIEEYYYRYNTNENSGEYVYVYSCPGNGETTTSVENVPEKVKRNAYPNPATDLVTLPYDANGATSMKIYDMQGKLVERKFLDKNKQELQLNVKDYPSGMYFFEVNGESNSFIVE